MSPVVIKCNSVDGELLKISTIEFQKKILCYQRVAAKIKENIENKLEYFIMKTKERFNTIKDFNGVKPFSQIKISQLMKIHDEKQRQRDLRCRANRGF